MALCERAYKNVTLASRTNMEEVLQEPSAAPWMPGGGLPEGVQGGHGKFDQFCQHCANNGPAMLIGQAHGRWPVDGRWREVPGRWEGQGQLC